MAQAVKAWLVATSPCFSARLQALLDGNAGLYHDAFKGLA